MSYNFCHVQSQNAKTLTQGQKTTFHNTLFEMNFSRDRELLMRLFTVEIIEFTLFSLVCRTDFQFPDFCLGMIIF